MVTPQRVGHEFSPAGSTHDPVSFAFAQSDFRLSGTPFSKMKIALLGEFHFPDVTPQRVELWLTD